jgi:hypothetical protein
VELLHWKAAKRIFGHADREMIISGWFRDELPCYLDKVYSDAKYHDLELVEAIQLVAVPGGTLNLGPRRRRCEAELGTERCTIPNLTPR